MESTLAAPASRRRWGARVLTALPLFFLLFDVAIKLGGHPSVAEASAQLGLPDGITRPVALLLAACLVLTVVPRTAPLGAILLTGYLGGAVLVHVRVGSPLFSHTLFPVYVGALLWAGLFFGDVRVRGLFIATKETP